VCCGTKREVEIDCPSDCVYLHVGRKYESGKLARTARGLDLTYRLWSKHFLEVYHPVVLGLSQVITEARLSLPELVDSDVQAALASLIQTFQTLDKGIYYESRPNHPYQRELYFALKLLLEGPEHPRIIDRARLTTHEILDCLQFLKELSTVVALPRPKSRAFLDHIENLTHDSPGRWPETSTLIVPG
jgi:hypothetical protein